ncbi:hypothetical protein PGT21_022282 [Puccinia graminis f. sp. tritici]|nr:hypothetical protein PGT21_022282 [Puccinia graminis f. sp. tritici]KAA1136478.1 hypothetical protein PGTUg99_033395 [Puccinia graminis f. sp. tritici]
MKNYAFMIALWFTCLIASKMALVSRVTLKDWISEGDLPSLSAEERLVVHQLSPSLGSGARLKAHETSVGYTSGNAKATLTWSAQKNGVVIHNQCNYPISYALMAHSSGLWYYGSGLKSRHIEPVSFGMGQGSYDGDITMFILAGPKE